MFLFVFYAFEDYFKGILQGHLRMELDPIVIGSTKSLAALRGKMVRVSAL